MMLKLNSLENTELSKYCVNILEKHGITLVREFVAENPEKIMKILNLNFNQVKKIKDEFQRLYASKPLTEDFLKKEAQKKKIYGTNIESLDDMLAPQEVFGNFSFWEISGPTGVGKTQLAFTLILNFIINQVTPVLYIDTKLDFCASRIKNMLQAREIELDEYAGIMSFIKVERVLSAQGVVEMLEEFYKQLQQGNKDVAAIKMIVIDSLPAVWFLLKADSNRLAGKWLLSRLSQIINLLLKQHYIAVICINLSLIPSNEENKTKPKVVTLTANNDNEVSDLIENDDMQESAGNSSSVDSYQTVLGHFWMAKPHVRLSLEFPEKNDVDYERDSSLRVIKLLNARFCPSGRNCSVRLQEGGFT